MIKKTNCIKYVFKFSLMLMVFSTVVYSQEFPLFKVNGDEIGGLTSDREIKMQHALNVFAQVMNDKDFQVEVANYVYQYDLPNDPNSNLTPYQVAVKIYEGQEFYKNENDHIANIHWIIKMKKRPCCSVRPAIGYGMPNDIEIYTYSWFFDEPNNLASIAGHIAHEWSHKIGFGHKYKYHDTRDFTVPYAFGAMVEKFAPKYISN